MLNAGDFFVIPGLLVAERTGRHSPTTVAQIKRAAGINLIVAQQFGPLKNMIVMLESCGEVVFIENWQPDIPADHRAREAVGAVGGIKRHMINCKMKWEILVGFHLGVEPGCLFGAVPREM